MTVTSGYRVADLDQNKPTEFDLRPDADTLKALAAELGISALRKLSFSGRITAQGRRDWVLTARLGATVVQPCVVSLDPVTTRIDTDVRRTFLADMPEIDQIEAEMPEDETLEQLGSFIDPNTVMIEALALALPLYPRKEGADLGEAVFAAPGTEPLRDEDTRPFAGLSGLRDALKKEN